VRWGRKATGLREELAGLPRSPGLIWRRQVSSGQAAIQEASDDTADPAETAKLVLANQVSVSDQPEAAESSGSAPQAAARRNRRAARIPATYGRAALQLAG
jgi:hypothetical protein